MLIVTVSHSEKLLDETLIEAVESRTVHLRVFFRIIVVFLILSVC